MIKHLLVTSTAVVAAITLPARAVVVTQWNFNSVPPDATLSTGTSVPSGGLGSLGLFGGPSFLYADGSGSSDPQAGDNTAWFTRPYPAQGQGNRSAGVQFAVSTAGFKDIVVTWDQRHAGSASKHVQVLYTTDGINFVDAPGGPFGASLGGDIWYLRRSVNLTGIAGVNDNAAFAVRIVSIFAPGTSEYEPSSVGAGYGQNGTLTYDMVTVSATPIPEPGTFGMLAFGLVALGARASRQRDQSVR